MAATKTYRVVSPPDRDDPPEGFPVFRIVDKETGETAPGKEWFVGDTISTGDVTTKQLAWFEKIGALEAADG